MKAQQRHQLKQNEFVEVANRIVAAATANSRRLIVIGVVVVLVLGAIGAVVYLRSRTENAAGRLLAVAMSIREAPVTPETTLPDASQATATYRTTAARNQAALAAFEEVAAEYPDTDAGLTARYQAAGLVLATGDAAGAEARFREIADASDAGLYGPMARLGVAEALVAQGRFDDAVAILTELSADREGSLPVDAVLMQLGRVQVRAGRTDDARAAFRRVVDEFPDSAFVDDARQELETLG